MALEDEVKALREAVLALTAAITASGSAAADKPLPVKEPLKGKDPAEPSKEVKIKPEVKLEGALEVEVDAPDYEAYYKETLQPVFASLIVANREAAVRVLADFSVSKAVQLSPAKYQAFVAAVEAALEEGAANG